jgi:hypothetical protein
LNNKIFSFWALGRHGARFKQLYELITLARLDPIAADFYYHHLPPVAKDCKPTYERQQEGTFR